MPSFRSFAVVPAAGASVRMGQPKLLLPWGDSTILETTLDAWRTGGVKVVVVVVPPGQTELADLCWQAGAEVVVPKQPPAEMKDSIRLALRHISTHLRPREGDAWLVAPADLPQLSPIIIGRLLDEHLKDASAVRVPTIAGRWGHPVLFPWSLATKVGDLGANEGLNVLVEREGAVEVACDDIAAPTAFADVDTPEDYERGTADGAA